jgi:uncharacterized protein YjeT (DUF2065 family)
MVFPRVVLVLTAAVLAVIGVGFLIAPAAWARAIEVAVSSPTGRTDVRATYGGFVLAAGIFLAVCAVHPGWIRPGLLACALILGGFAAGRLVGLVVEGSLSRLMTFFLAIEMAGAAAALIAFFRTAS